MTLLVSIVYIYYLVHSQKMYKLGDDPHQGMICLGPIFYELSYKRRPTFHRLSPVSYISFITRKRKPSTYPEKQSQSNPSGARSNSSGLGQSLSTSASYTALNLNDSPNEGCTLALVEIIKERDFAFSHYSVLVIKSECKPATLGQELGIFV
jgi:hypothetical protein